MKILTPIAFCHYCKRRTRKRRFGKTSCWYCSKFSERLREFMDCLIIIDDLYSTEKADDFWDKLTDRGGSWSDIIYIKALANLHHIC